MRKTRETLDEPILTHCKLLRNKLKHVSLLSAVKSLREVNSTAFLGKLFGLLTTLLKVRTFFLMSDINLSHIHPLVKKTCANITLKQCKFD